LYLPDSNGNLPTQTGGTTVYVNGVPAPVMYSWSTQVGVVVPYEVTPGSGGITVQYGGRISLQLPVTIAATSPGIFTADSSGKGQAVAINEADGRVDVRVPAGVSGNAVPVAISIGGVTSQPGVTIGVASSGSQAHTADISPRRERVRTAEGR
jgi:hypothetical protein